MAIALIMDLRIVHDQRSVDGDGERLTAFVELPSVETGGSVTKVEAGMPGQIARRLRPGMRCEVARGSGDRGPLIG